MEIHGLSTKSGSPNLKSVIPNLKSAIPEKFEKFQNLKNFKIWKISKFEKFEKSKLGMAYFKLGLADLKQVSYPKVNKVSSQR